jgi:hypothetical protein
MFCWQTGAKVYNIMILYLIDEKYLLPACKGFPAYLKLQTATDLGFPSY